MQTKPLSLALECPALGWGWNSVAGIQFLRESWSMFWGLSRPCCKQCVSHGLFCYGIITSPFLRLVRYTVSRNSVLTSPDKSARRSCCCSQKCFTGWGKSRFTVVSAWDPVIMYYYLLMIVLFSMQTIVDLLLPTLYKFAINFYYCFLPSFQLFICSQLKTYS